MIRIRLAEIAAKNNKNMSQVQRESGLTMGMIRRYWNSEPESVQLDAIEKLCKLFGVPVGEMLAIEEGAPDAD
jgi:DNA-binding Xre family transcriptional regulator